MKKNWLVFLLIAIVGIAFFYQKNKITNLQNELIEMQLSTGNLAEEVVSLMTFDDNILTKISRIDGTDTTIVERIYVPVETEVITTVTLNQEALTQLEEAQILLDSLMLEASTPEDTIRIAELEEAILNLQRNLYVTKVEFDNKGWCAEPCLVGGIDSNISGMYGIGARLYFSGRFGFGIQATLDEEEHGSLGLYGDWRIPKHETIAPYGALDYDFDREKAKLGVGIHIYF